MCGRYDLNVRAQEIAARFLGSLRDAGNAANASTGPMNDVKSVTNVGWQPRYNIAPGQNNPVIVRDASGHNRLEFMRWGLVPAWSREAKVPYSTINARAETVASKPTFRKQLATQRCLVPATGYFEWAQGALGKQPYRIQLRDESWSEGGGIFAFAGLYDIWEGPDGEELQTYAVVTTEANDAIKAIHARMPVILTHEAEGAWLAQGDQDIAKLLALLQPYAGEWMTAYPVSSLVNSPMNDRRELIEPTSLMAA